MSFRNIIFLLLLVAALPAARAAETAAASDTLSLTLKQAEEQFLQRNLLLLAQKYHIEAAHASVLQARLRPNPTLYLEQNIYNTRNEKYFDAGYSGQNIVQLQQVVQLAGKRNKRIRVEQLNARLTEHEFYDLLRTLTYELRSSFFEVYYLQQSIQIYDQEIGSVQKLVGLFGEQYRKGNISLKESTRLKALLYALQNERLARVLEINERQATLNLLLRNPAGTYLRPVVTDDAQVRGQALALNLPALQEQALQHRYDLKTYETSLELQKANLNLQRSLAVPNLSIGGVYDRQGSFIRNYTGLSLGIELPVFDRNQGNIAMARHKVEQSRIEYEQYQDRVLNEVAAAVRTAREADQLYSSFDTQFNADFDRLIEGVLQNYQKQNISLLEFLDYYETYKESRVQLYELLSRRRGAFEQLNFAIGQTQFNQ